MQHFLKNPLTSFWLWWYTLHDYAGALCWTTFKNCCVQVLNIKSSVLCTVYLRYFLGTSRFLRRNVSISSSSFVKQVKLCWWRSLYDKQDKATKCVDLKAGEKRWNILQPCDGVRQSVRCVEQLLCCSLSAREGYCYWKCCTGAALLKLNKYFLRPMRAVHQSATIIIIFFFFTETDNYEVMNPECT